LHGHLTHERYEEIKREITFMYEEAEVHCYPIDCFLIANRLHYIVRPYSSLSEEGRQQAIETDPDGFSKVEVNPFTGMYEYVIYYNDECKIPGRIRWTIFHEIGHIYLGHHDHPDDSFSAIEEEEANFFAKYAIAPHPLIRKLNCQSPWDIQTTFETSGQAAGYIYEMFMNRVAVGPRYYLDYELNIVKLFNVA